MFVGEWLSRHKVSNLTQEEATMLGFDWPLKRNWKNTELKITDEDRARLALKFARKLRNKKVAIKKQRRKFFRKLRKDERKAKQVSTREAKDVSRQQRVAFYASDEWKAIRYKVLKNSRGRCCLCGRTASEANAPLHVDHIVPRSKSPNLELEEANLQVLCADCNLGKGNKDSIDWRNV